MSSPPQMSGPVVLVQQLNGNSDGPVHYVSITEEQLRGLTISSTAVVKAGLEHKIQENQVIDFLALNEDVQFIKTESCVPSPSADGSTDFGGDVDVSVIDTFDASPLLHEASKDVALTNLQENLANLPALHADENAGASNAEYETEDLLLAQLQAQQGTVQRDGEEAVEVDDDERAASEYLNDGQLYLEKSKRLDNFVHHPQSALKCQQQQQQQHQQQHHTQQLQHQHQHQHQQQQQQQQQQPQHMDCTSTNLIETSSTAEDEAVRCSSEAQTDVAEVSSTTLDPSTTSPTHPDNTISASRAPPPTLNIVDHVASSTPAVLADNKIRVVSFSGANILTSAGEPVLLGNFLLVPGTSTMKLQIVQEASAGSMKEVSVRGVGSDGGLSQTALGLDGLTLSNISLLSQGLNLQNGLTGHQDKKSQRPFQCKLCTATFTRLGNYTRHQRIHTVRSKEDERFHCKECGKSFIQRCDLTRHLHVHAGTEPHRCDRCGKGYIRHSDLVTHQRFHNKEKPFVCDHCQKGFSQRGDLNRHMRSIHLQIRPLTCNHCQKKFAKEATLIRHTRTSHREIVLANWGLKTGGDPDSISEALITGTGDVCSPTALGIRD